MRASGLPRSAALLAGALCLLACASAPGPADRDGAGKIVAATELSACRPTHHATPGRTRGHVTLVFEPSGAVQSVMVDGGPWINTDVGRCVESAFRARRIPAFTGPALKLGRSFDLD